MENSITHQNVILKCSTQEISTKNDVSNINLGDCIDGRRLDETHFQTPWNREDLMSFSEAFEKNGLNHLKNAVNCKIISLTKKTLFFRM